jgi:indolepyruvate ferredoxin oxidoreductase beta subunit
MEPIEAMRSLGEFGNPNVVLIVNSRPVYPYGNVAYPDLNQVKKLITKFSSNSKFVNATEEALKMGSPIYTNIILLGSLVGAEVLPVQKETMINVLKGNFPDRLIEINIQAFNKGMEIITAA